VDPRPFGDTEGVDLLAELLVLEAVTGEGEFVARAELGDAGGVAE
jgi:hypothetical protein